MYLWESYGYRVKKETTFNLYFNFYSPLCSELEVLSAALCISSRLPFSMSIYIWFLYSSGRIICIQLFQFIISSPDQRVEHWSNFFRNEIFHLADMWISYYYSDLLIFNFKRSRQLTHFSLYVSIDTRRKFDYYDKHINSLRLFSLIN